MEQGSSKRTNFIVILTSAALISALMFAGKTPLDSDPIWSSAVGQWIYFNHSVPYFDPFSWTVAGQHWISHEWLYCLITFFMRSHFGDLGLFYLGAINLLLLSGMIYIWVDKLNPSRISSVICAMAMILLALYVSPRAYVTTYYLFLLLFYILHFHARDKYLYAVPLILILWVNLHSTAIYGVGMLVVESLYRTITRKEEAARLWLITVLSGLATLVNPYSYKIWIYIAQFSFHPVSRYVSEWKAPDFTVKAFLLIYIMMMGIAIFFFIRFARQGLKYEDNDIMYPFWFVAFYLYSLTSIRGGGYAIIFWLIMVIYYLRRLYSIDLPSRIQIMVISLLLVGALVVVSNKPVVVYNPDKWPLAAVEYLEKNPQYQERLFNQHIYGGLLIDKGIRPFIDARGDVYVLTGVFEDAVNIYMLKKPPLEVFDKYGIKNVLMENGSALDIYLQGRPGWKEIYRDRVAVIYSAR